MQRRHVLAAAGASLGSGCLGSLRDAVGDSPPDQAAGSAGGSETWPMYGSGAANSGYVPAGTGPINEVTDRWTFTTGAEVGSSPAVVDGMIYIGSADGNVYALDAADGNVRWTYETDGAVFSSPAMTVPHHPS